MCVTYFHLICICISYFHIFNICKLCTYHVPNSGGGGGVTFYIKFSLVWLKREKVVGVWGKVKKKS